MTLRLLLFTVLTSVFSVNVNAQIAIPKKGSVWIYDYVNAGSRGPKISSYDRDTMLGGKPALVLDGTFYELANPRMETFNYAGCMVTIDDSLVSYWNDNQWDTLYYFGAEVGDSWKYYFVFSGEDTLNATVLDKGIDQNLGMFVSLEYEYFDKDFRVLESWKDTIYELTLGGTEYIIPWDNVVMKLDGQSGGPLECFSNSKGRYRDKVWTAGGEACTDIVEKLSVDQLAEDNLFSIHPNPSKGMISINANQKPAKMEVYNTLGALVFSSETEFRTQILSPQLYVVKLWRNDGLVEVHRVVVE